MVHQYAIEGMSCNGCRKKVEDRLNAIPGIRATVSLDPPEADITMEKHVSDEKLQRALSEVGHYHITSRPHSHNHKNNISHEGAIHDHQPAHKHHPQPTHSAQPSALTGHSQSAQPSALTGPSSGGSRIFYCPMHCEGDKTYDKPGNCPVCGMHLVEQPSITATRYTCPMHPEILRDQPGSCPICGMDLVPADAGEEDVKGYEALKKKFIVAILFTVPIFVLSMSGMLNNNPIDRIISPRLSNWLQLFLSLPVVFYACWSFFVTAWVSFRTMRLNMFSLIGLGAAAGFIFSVVALLMPEIFPTSFRGHDGSVHLYFEAVVVILTLVLLGQLMESRAHARTGSAIKELLKLAPADAVIIREGVASKILISEIVPGNILQVKPGGRVPVDGELIEGNTNIDESMITGEPMPVEKKAGDKLSAGTINGNTSFLMKAERVGQDTLLARIIQMVNDASRSQAPIQRLVDKVAGFFVPIVIAIAAITFVAWSVFGGEQGMVYGWVNALAVLIVACPCALGLATPMSVMVGVGKGARSGVLIKNAQALENMNKANVLIVDKTGTITEGKPSVQQVISLSPYQDIDVLRLAAAVNQNSEHPLAAAVLEKAKKDRLAISAVSDFHVLAGKGVVGTVVTDDSQRGSQNTGVRLQSAGKKSVAIGNEALMRHENVPIAENLLEEAVVYQRQGKTVSFVAVDRQLAGYLVIVDAVKHTSVSALKSLRSTGVRVVMLTGDNKNTAAAVAAEVGLDEFHAQFLPQDKLEKIKSLQADGSVVMMAGDGINDAPALTQADIGIAMGTGTDVAIESADITLVKGDLGGIAKARNLSRRVMRNIKQNLFFAFIYNVVGIPVAAGVLYPAFGILMSPMIAAAAMTFSSLSVILNALRLRNIQLG